MDIKLKNGETLDSKPDFKLSLTLNNPMLTEQGSMSLPVVLPESNRRKLGFPDRLDHAYKIKQVFNTVIGAGSYQKPALLRTTSHNKGTIGAFYLNESEMYAKMKDVDLSQAFNIIRPASDFLVAGTFAETLDMVIKYMELVMVDNIKEDFHLFPVATDYYTETVHTGFGDKEYTFYQVLNEQMSGQNRNDNLTDIDLNGEEYYMLAGRNARQYNEGGSLVDVPKGYGITPFLKQSYVLHRIFEYFGYRLEESIFDTDPEFQKMVLVNNTADAIVRGELNYAQLVPSGTIKDYLDSVRTDYGCEFFISPDHKYVEVKFWNDLIQNKKFIPLDSKATGKEIPNLAEPKLLKLTGNRSIEYTDVNFDTQEKFEQNYGQLKYAKDTIYQGRPDYPAGYYLIQALGDIYERYPYVNDSGNTVRGWRYHSKYLFDSYEEKTDTDYEDKASKRDYIASISAFVHYTGTLVGVNIPGEYHRMLFIGNRRHLNTFVKKLHTDENGNQTVADEKEDTVSCPIMTAFYRGKTSPAGRPRPVIYGNIMMYDDQGEPFEGGFNLIFGGENGLYNKFWKLYANVIRHSFLQVEIPLKLDIRDILTFRFDNIYLYKGQPLVPEKLEFEIEKDNKIKVVSALFRTIRLYLDR